MTEMEIYWLLKLDSISSLFEILVFVFVVVGVGTLYFKVLGMEGGLEDCTVKLVNKLFTISLIIVLISTPCVVLLPSTKQMVKIKVYPMLLTKTGVKELKKIPPRLLNILNLSLDKLEKVATKNKKEVAK